MVSPGPSRKTWRTWCDCSGLKPDPVAPKSDGETKKRFVLMTHSSYTVIWFVALYYTFDIKRIVQAGKRAVLTHGRSD